MIMYYSVSSKCKIIKKNIFHKQKIIIFFKKKMLDKAFFRYYICSVKTRTNLQEGGVDYDCFMIFIRTEKEPN